ncbi:MAG: hypothetical protein DI537_49650 [Stutzerimonas stutzeri]|jgi:transcriptional regulator GlxA family with amidase domain|nr:MAG: hypothetical protein DI537_49650 [Stutzerimonas stutzeri]
MDDVAISAQVQMGDESSKMYVVVFLLTPEFSLTNVACAIDTLRVANSILETPRYKWILATDSVKDVPSSSGLTLTTDIEFTEVNNFDLLLVCGSFKPQEQVTDSTQNHLRRLARYGKTIGSMEAGAYHVAKAGVFDGHRVSVHFANLPIYERLFPRVNFVKNIFSHDVKRESCAGGVTSLDLMLDIVKRDLGLGFALRVANLLNAPGIRDENELQGGFLLHLDTKLPEAVQKACRVMENHIEVPIPIDLIATTAGVSRRQLDRLFHRVFSATASDVYVSIRLSRARKMLRSTRMGLTTIAEACGFLSYPHFSRSYRKMFGWSPVRERRQPNGASITSLRLMPSYDLHPDQTLYARDRLL